MNSSPHRKQKFLGVLLLLALPVCFLAAGAYSFYQPRLFSATTGFQLLYPDADTSQLQGAFQKAQQEYASRPKLRLASRFSLNQSATANQFSITAVDTDPLTTSNTANTLTIFVSDFLRAAGKDDARRMTILQKAEIPKAPSFPNVRRIMTTGISLGLVLAIAGVFVLSANTTRAKSNESIP